MCGVSVIQILKFMANLIKFLLFKVKISKTIIKNELLCALILRIPFSNYKQ